MLQLKSLQLLVLAIVNNLILVIQQKFKPTVYKALSLSNLTQLH